jgi:hypothetical protein
MGVALREQGKFREALTALRKAQELGVRRPGGPSQLVATNIRQCERLLHLEHKLPSVLNGGAEPVSASERLELSYLCAHPGKRLHATAARFAAEAFATNPKQAANLQAQYRYNAACSAVLAAAGQAEDARFPPDKVALRLRHQALRWLQADLALYAGLAQRDDPRLQQAVQQRLAHWQQDADLAWVRGPQALARLDDDERQQWQKLWQDVAALLRKVVPKK